METSNLKCILKIPWLLLISIHNRLQKQDEVVQLKYLICTQLKKKSRRKILTWISRSARENGRGATGAIWVVNCELAKLVAGGALLKGDACACEGALNGDVMPNGLCCCWGWGVWNSDGVCCCCCCWGWDCWPKGVEKSEPPNAGVEGVPKAGVEEGVPKAGEEDWAPNIFGWWNPRFWFWDISQWRF